MGHNQQEFGCWNTSTMFPRKINRIFCGLEVASTRIDTKHALLHETGFFFMVPKLFYVMRVRSTKNVINSVNKCESYFDDLYHERDKNIIKFNHNNF